MKRKTEMRENLSSRVLLRTEVIQALERAAGGKGDAEHLHELAKKLVIMPGSGNGNLVWAYSRLVEGLSWAIRWEPAVASADANPVRFRDAAKHHAGLVQKRFHGKSISPEILAAMNALANLEDIAQVSVCAELLLRIPLPSTVTEVTHEKVRHAPKMRTDESVAEPLPVLVLLSIDSQPIQSPVAIHPHHIYELRVSSKVSHWPNKADSLVIDFIGTLSRQLIELGSVELGRNDLTSNTNLMIRGELARGRTEAFHVRAAFKLMDGSLEPVKVVGHPRLTIATFDHATAIPINLPTAQLKLQEMLATLDAKLPHLPRDDRRDLFTLLESLLRYSNRAMQDRLLANQPQILEADFQRDLKSHFYADPNIGARLWEAPKQGGGITDLGLGEVVLELKVEHGKHVTMPDAVGYMSQPTQYASAKDRQVSILCILDDSEKSSPPGVIGNYVEWLFPSTHGLIDPAFPSMVAAVIVPTRFPTPSTWSR
jgi:hypothetical protein